MLRNSSLHQTSCHCSLIVGALAYFSLAYLIASVVYLVATRCLGTPFRDSLSSSQIHIKKSSQRVRGLVFSGGLMVAILLLVALRPLRMGTVA